MKGGTRWVAATVAGAAVAMVLSGCAADRGNDPAGAAESISGLTRSALDIMASPPYAHAVWAVKVSDIATGESLVSYNAGLLLEPASVTKTYSVGAAWLQFGPDSRIVTPVVRAGRVRNGSLSGDLVLVAKGDITMGGQTGPGGKVVYTNLDHNDANAVPGATITDNNPLAGLDHLARQVRAAGISRVDGQVIVDDRMFKTADLGETDGPVSPIVINNNLIDVVTTPTQPGATAKSAMRPVVAPWTLDERVRTVAAGGPTEIRIDASNKDVITVAGTIAADSDPVLKVWHFADPPTFARTAFIEALRRAGVDVAAPAVRTNPTAGLGSPSDVAALPRVAALEGLPFEETATYILKVSYNRGAQTQVCLLAVAAGSRNCDAGFPKMAELLKRAGVDPLSAALVDGTGQPGNYITADSEAQLMTAFAHRADGARWRSTLPILGVDGSLANVAADSPAAGHVSAKTGTNGAGDLLNNRFRIATKALGGYITAKSGRELAVTIIVNQAMFDDLDGISAANDDLGKIAASIWEAY